jgi:hypothetical protein
MFFCFTGLSVEATERVKSQKTLRDTILSNADNQLNFTGYCQGHIH